MPIQGIRHDFASAFVVLPTLLTLKTQSPQGRNCSTWWNGPWKALGSSNLTKPLQKRPLVDVIGVKEIKIQMTKPSKICPAVTMVWLEKGVGDLRAEAKAIQKAIRDANFDQDEMRVTRHRSGPRVAGQSGRSDCHEPRRVRRNDFDSQAKQEDLRLALLEVEKQFIEALSRTGLKIEDWRDALGTLAGAVQRLGHHWECASGHRAVAPIGRRKWRNARVDAEVQRLYVCWSAR